jgi:hypothetical protein
MGARHLSLHCIQRVRCWENHDTCLHVLACSGNDFSTLYAPLIRDGRMEKYYCEWCTARQCKARDNLQAQQESSAVWA